MGSSTAMENISGQIAHVTRDIGKITPLRATVSTIGPMAESILGNGKQIK